MQGDTGIETLSERLDSLYEFEREPVTPDKLHDGRYFAAMFAGEHVAGTEFVIGALFAKWGASASDLVWGLLIGNLLAVLSWAFICAPIAVRVRLTLYWYARRVIGPGLTVLYNIVNSVLYCCLAAAMIGVSASAVILGLDKYAGAHIRHPELNDLYPNGIGWVLVVLVVGLGTTCLAVAGFKRLSQFAAVCSPWMFVIFVAGALATLPGLGEIRSPSQLWNVFETRVWTGVPLHGGTPLGFWHVTFFAWFCNLAMHIGLSDMAVFRYARRWTYGFYSAFGMYLGHYVAWICAGIMGAVLGSALNPGQMADHAAGTAGLLCVLLAGWTTANPTIYRAGLALQIVTPNWPRWVITLVAGGMTTFVALFPAIFMQLLDFVAIYGLMLMPIGAVIFAEHWLLPRLGFRQYWTQRDGVSVNVPALIAWVVVTVLCFPIEQFTGGRVRSPMEILGVHLFFRWLPGWFLSVLIYLGLCRLWPAARAHGDEAPVMDATARGQMPPTASQPNTGARGKLTPVAIIAGALAVLALIICIAMPIRVFLGGSDPDVYAANLASAKRAMIVATIFYFIGAVIWESRRESTRGREAT